MRTKINSSLKRLVLRLQKTNPHLGVRGLTSLLATRHHITLSKSAVNTIVQYKGQKRPRGRKKSILAYARKNSSFTGLLLLECIDAHVGLFNHVTEELHVYLPKLRPALLNCIVRLVSFAAYSTYAKENLRKADFLRMSGLHTFPLHKINYFLARVKEYTPVVSLAKVKDNVKLVSTIKFYFENGTRGFSDARFSTLWDSHCTISYFFSPCIQVRRRIAGMLKERYIFINYTKSFDYLSLLVVRFIEGLQSGLQKVEFLDEGGKVLETVACASIKPSFFIGYYPKILNKGVFFLGQAPRFKRIRAQTEALYTTISTRFVQQKTNKGIILNNILLKRKEKELPVWGVLTGTKDRALDCLNDYLQFFPSMDSAFIEEMKVIERFFLDDVRHRDLGAFVPADITFESENDFAGIINILASVFKEEIGNFDFNANIVTFRQSKNNYLFAARSASGEVKKKFNAADLSFRGKHACLQS
ncbi:MAG: hypothetical protein PHV55_04570 [Candidatus Omnitrophica bacterium]|nr:hypothetical protein [Candidatus Omnitrophota bacterium]